MAESYNLNSVNEAIKRQRRRLRSTWPEGRLTTWGAHTMALLRCIELLSPLTKRFEDIMAGSGSVSSKAQAAREILNSVVEVLDMPVMVAGKGGISPTTGSETHIHVTIPQTINQMQEQKIIQKIQPDWSSIASQIDGDDAIPAEKKQEAKEHARTIWDGIVNKSKDIATILGAVHMLVQLGMAMPKIASMFGLGG
jgi:hypothetical protein